MKEIRRSDKNLTCDLCHIRNEKIYTIKQGDFYTVDPDNDNLICCKDHSGLYQCFICTMDDYWNEDICPICVENIVGHINHLKHIHKD